MEITEANAEINKIVSSLEREVSESIAKANCKFRQENYYISTIPSRRWGHMLHELGGYIAHSKQLAYNNVILFEESEASKILLESIILPEHIEMIPYSCITKDINDFYKSITKILSSSAKQQLLTAFKRGVKLGHNIDVSANKSNLSKFYYELDVDVDELFWPWMDLLRLPIHISGLIHPNLNLKNRNQKSISNVELCALSQESGIRTDTDYINTKILNCIADDIFWALYGRLQAMNQPIVINIRDIYIENSINNVRNNNIQSIKYLIDALLKLGYDEIVFTGPNPRKTFKLELDEYLNKKIKCNYIYLFNGEFIFGQNTGVGQSVMVNLLLEPLAISKAPFVIGAASGGVALPLIMNKPTIHIDSMHYITPFPQSINITKTFQDPTYNNNHLTAIKMLNNANHQVIPNESCTQESINSACKLAQNWSHSKVRPLTLINKNTTMKKECANLNKNKEHRYVLLSWGDNLIFNNAIHIDYDGASYRFE